MSTTLTRPTTLTDERPGGAGASHGGGPLHADPGTPPMRGAEPETLELSSPLDIPAFLRRQEG